MLVANDFSGTFEFKSRVLSSGDEVQPPHLVSAGPWGRPPALCSSVTERSDLWALPWGGTYGDRTFWPAALWGASLLLLPLTWPGCWACRALPAPPHLALPPDHCLGTQGTGEQGESQLGPPLQVALPRFVLKYRSATPLLTLLYLSVREAGYF